MSGLGKEENGLNNRRWVLLEARCLPTATLRQGFSTTPEAKMRSNGAGTGWALGFLAEAGSPLPLTKAMVTGCWSPRLAAIPALAHSVSSWPSSAEGRVGAQPRLDPLQPGAPVRWEGTDPVFYKWTSSQAGHSEKSCECETGDMKSSEWSKKSAWLP